MAFWGKKRSDKLRESSQSSNSKEGLTFDKPLFAENSSASQRLTENYQCRKCGSSGVHKMIGGSTWVRQHLNGSFEGFRIQVAECKQCRSLVPVVFIAYDSIQQVVDAHIKLFGKDSSSVGIKGGLPALVVARGADIKEYIGHCLSDSDRKKIESNNTFNFNMPGATYRCTNCTNDCGAFVYDNGKVKCRYCGSLAYDKQNNRVENLKSDAADFFKEFSVENPNKSESFKWLGVSCKNCSNNKYILIETNGVEEMAGGVVCSACEDPVYLDDGAGGKLLWYLNDEMVKVIKSNMVTFNKEAGGA